MKKWTDELRGFWRDKYFMLALAFTAIGSYGFLITHATVGIDDTPYAYYFEEGLAAIVGRWVMFLLNKVVQIADFAPFLTDLAGVVLMAAAAMVWCVLLKRIFGSRVPGFGYLLFGCLFLSNPLLSEVFPYYLHNGVGLGYLSCGLSLWFYWEGLERERLAAAVSCWAGSALCLWVALGCYESFMVVYLVGVCIALCGARMQGKGLQGGGAKVFRALCVAAVTAAAALLLRSLMIGAVTAMFGLEGLKEEAVQRSVSEMAGWMFRPGAGAELAMILKRVFVMYGVFGYAYYPIGVYVIAGCVALAAGVWGTIRRKDAWVLALTAGSFAASFLLVFIEGKATLYRSAQFLPLFSAWGLFLLVYLVQGIVRKLAEKPAGNRGSRLSWGTHLAQGIHLALGIGLAAVVWNQCSQMNRWFYVDYLKYEDAKNTMNQIAYELEKGFDVTKPVIFTGTYSIPRSIIEDAYVPYQSEIFHKMNRLTSLVDEHLLEKFYREYGVWVAQTPSLSVLDWGRYAFDNNEELVRFFAMHGHELKAQTDTSLYEPAEEYSLTLPSFPQEGAIVDMGEYIIVHF